MDKLPEDWKLTPLNRCVKITGGGTPSKKIANFYDGDIPWATVRDMNVEILKSTEFFISKEGLIKSSSNIIPKGSLIIATRVGLGKVCFLAMDTAINQDLKGLTPNSDANVKYLFYWLRNISEYIVANGIGATVKGVKLDFIKNLKIPLAPIPEQKRIVSKLDAVFERINQSIALLEENIKQTAALMASVLDEVFGEIDQEKFLPLLEICSPSKETLIPIDNEEYNYVGLENIQSNTGRIINFSRTEGKNIKSTKVRFKRGAVLYGKLRPYLNKVYVADFDGIATTEIMPFQTRKDLLNASFLAYFLRSPRFVALVNQYTSGARMPRATTTFFKKVAKVPVIPLNSQEKIVKKLDSYSKSIEGLLQEQKSKLNHLKSLKESILDKAFKGEL